MIEDFDRDLFKKCMPYFDTEPVIFDVGAHNGAFTKFVEEIRPDGSCFLFEPNAAIFDDLFESYAFSFNLAVSDIVAYKTFYKCPNKNDELSSLYKRKVFEETGFEQQEVKCVTIDYFCNTMHLEEIDYIKVDVEGAELDVLNGCPSMMRNKKIKFIQIEYGGTYIDAGITFVEIIQTANLFGYRVYELIENKFSEVTEENFKEDYRYGVFLLTYLPCS